MKQSGSLHFAALGGTGYQGVITFAFLAFLFRHESASLDYAEGCRAVSSCKDLSYNIIVTLMRILIVALMVGWCAIPLATIKSESLGGSAGAEIAILFIDYIIPLLLGGGILFAGPYDYVAVKAEHWL